MDFKDYGIEGIDWESETGITQGEGEKKRIISNAVPIVEGRTSIERPASGIFRKTIKIQYMDCNGARIGGIQELEEADIMNGKFMNSLPIEVQIYTKRICRDIFQKIIQAQAAEILIEKIVIHPFGWFGKKFYWNEEGRWALKEREYGAAVKVTELLCVGNQPIMALLLAAVHGPMKHILVSAGIKHDFVTFLTGPTAIGKTALAKKICGHVKNKPVVLALSSERKNLRKAIQDLTDITVVVDDFNTSASDRMVSKQLQVVSEIIQGQCDAGDVILDETSTDKRGHNIHLVITSESVIRNASTMNRCFLADMQEPLPDGLWYKVSVMEEQHDFSTFVQSFLGYIEKNYDMVIRECKEDFRLYKRSARRNIESHGISVNRIAETLAVQFTLKKQIFNYLKTVGVDEKLCSRASKATDAGIVCSGQELQEEVGAITSKKTHMEFLPALADIISSAGNDYHMAKSEKQYRRKTRNEEHWIGFQENEGYISFIPSYMCQMIAEELGIDAVSASSLGKELSYYHLAHVDGSEQKQSCRWHTEGRYFHVHIRQLMELVRGESDFTDELIASIERDCQWGR